MKAMRRPRWERWRFSINHIVERENAMASDKMIRRLNEQVKNEWYSQFLYLDMMAWCYNNGYEGFGQWFRAQAAEEYEHGEKILRYIGEVDGDMEIPEIPGRDVAPTGIQQMFEATLEHEKKVTGMIHELVKLAREENDYATENFLQWYVAEQVEEESTARDILGQIERVKDAPGGLFMLENRLGQRSGSEGSSE